MYKSGMGAFSTSKWRSAPVYESVLGTDVAESGQQEYVGKWDRRSILPGRLSLIDFGANNFFWDRQPWNGINSTFFSYFTIKPLSKSHFLHINVHNIRI